MVFLQVVLAQLALLPISDAFFQMGRIIASTKMPSAKFVNPKNGATIQANTAFTIQMAISNMVTGNFVNPNTNYYSAPQRS